MVRPGDVAGCPSHGYILIRLDGMLHRAHRLAWFYVTGEWPPLGIDHSNLDRADNRWHNLRLATQSQNCANVRTRRNSASGLKGVVKHADKWRAMIRNKGRMHHLGLFPTKEEAHAAYVAAAISFYGEFARSG
jgi:hypothetical protein